MRKFVTLAALAAVAVVPSAIAEASTNTGKLVSYEDGKVTIKHKTAGKSTYVVNKKTDCGVGYGYPPQSGDSIKCSAFKQAKYEGKPTRVIWHKKDGKKIADQISVTVPTSFAG